MRCPDCDGRGAVEPLRSDEACTACAGTGRVSKALVVAGKAGPAFGLERGAMVWVACRPVEA